MIRATYKILLLAMLVALAPQPAWAQTASLVCEEGVPGTGSHLFDVSAQRGGFCEFQGIEHIFSQTICYFMTIVDTVLSSIYCGMQYTLVNILAVIITLYIAVYGALLLMGMAQLNAKDFLMRLLKIAVVWTFITQSAVGIEIAFRFFFLFATGGVTWVMGAVSGSLPELTPEGTQPVYGIVCRDEDAIQHATGFMAAFSRMDEAICTAVIGPLTAADTKVVGFFLALMVAFPPIVFLILTWLWYNFKVLASGLVTFLLGIASMAFLIAMAPIFLSFMLFQVTYKYFETWVKFMISFSLQIIVVFSVIALWLMVTVQFVYFFNEISATIFPDRKERVVSNVHSTLQSWGVCPYTFQEDVGGLGPYVECQDPDFNPDNPDLDPDTANQYRDEVIPVSALLLSQTQADGTMVNHTDYIFYIIYHLITLIVVAFGFDALMREAPRIAVYLAGPEYVPLIGGSGLGVNRFGQTRLIQPSQQSGAAAKSGGGLLDKAKKLIPPEASGKATQIFRESMEKIYKRPDSIKGPGNSGG